MGALAYQESRSVKKPWIILHRVVAPKAADQHCVVWYAEALSYGRSSGDRWSETIGVKPVRYHDTPRCGISDVGVVGRACVRIVDDACGASRKKCADSDNGSGEWFVPGPSIQGVSD